MIKLLWNTHNQIENNSSITKDQLAVNISWGNYHKKNSDKWIFEALSKLKFKIINDIAEIENEDILIIVDSSIENKTDFYNKLSLLCSKIFLIHLGDEPGLYNFSKIYQNCSYVWRTFCSSKYFNNDKVSCLPIGYKSGTLFFNKEKKRKYKWAFIGTPHRSSRHDILFQLSEIKPSFCHKTNKFNEKIIEVQKMSEVLSSTEFVPCPNGFFHPETYRVYEVLECESIPIVENAFNYYDRLFPGNPFLKVDRWIEAKEVIQKWNIDQIEKKRVECKNWWKNYKNQLQNNILNKIKS